MPKLPPIVPFVMSALGIVACASAPASALAQSSEPGAGGGAINLETPSVLSARQLEGRLDLRAFGGDEGLAYTTLGLRLGLNRGWEVALRSAFTDTSQLTLPGGGAIRHGGSDVEALAKYAFPQSGKAHLAAYAGISFPDTPARKSSVLTLGMADEMPLGDRVHVTLNPRAVLLSSNTIVGFGLGVHVKIVEHLSLVGDYTPILSGNNTRDTTTGAPRSHDVYGAALRYHTREDRLEIDLGYTNGTGFTTGASLTPGLDGSGAFYLSIRARR